MGALKPSTEPPVNSTALMLGAALLSGVLRLSSVALVDGPAPTQLAAVADGQATATDQNSLRVVGSSVSGSTGYQLFRSQTLNGIYTQVGGNLLTPVYLDQNLLANATYYYCWKAIGDGVAYLSSGLGVAFSGTTLAPMAEGDDVIVLNEAAYLSTWLEQADTGELIEQLAAGEWTPAGSYRLKHRGVKRDGTALPLPATRYRMRALTHQQSGAMDKVFRRPIGNSSKYFAGNRGNRGFNPPDADVVVQLPADLDLTVPTAESTPEKPVYVTLRLKKGQAIGFRVYGYTEGSLGIAFYLLEEPDVFYAFPNHESSKFSGTHLAVADNTLYILGLFVFGVPYEATPEHDYSGPGVLAIDLFTFQDKTFEGNPNVQTFPTQFHTYHALATKHKLDGGTQATSLTATAGKLFVAFGLENRVQMIDTSTCNTLANIPLEYPFAMAARDSTIWIAHETGGPQVVEQFTIGDAGVSATGLPLSGITNCGYLAYSWDGTELAAVDVAEDAILFFGRYTAQGEQMKGGRIYYVDGRMFRYVGPDGQYYTRDQWNAMADGGNDWFRPKSQFLESTDTHRVRIYDAATGAAVAVAGEGDYGLDPTVRNMKWFFGSQDGVDGQADSIFICPLPDGGWQFRDKANARIIRLDAELDYVSRESSTGSTYFVAGNSDDATEQWQKLRQYAHNLSNTSGGDGEAWNLVANYTAFTHPRYESLWSKMLVQADGHKLGIRRNKFNYKQVIHEVTSTGLIDWKIETKDLGSALLPGGSLFEVDDYEQGGGARRLTHKQYIGYNATSGPQYAQETTWATLPAVARREDPRLYEAPTRINARGEAWIYDPGLARQDSARGGLGCYHLGMLRKGSTNWELRNMPATEINVDVEDPVGNVFYAGSSILNGGTFISTDGDLSGTHKKDEFGWGANNMKTKFWYKGIYVFEAGVTRYGAFPLRTAEKGSGGNGDTGNLTLSGTTYRWYVGGEWGNGVPGTNCFEFSDFVPTLREYPAVPLTQWVADSTVPGAYSLMDASRWRQQLTPGINTLIKLNYDKLASRGRSRSITFDGYSDVPPGVDPHSYDICQLDPLPAGTRNWTLTGQQAIRQLDNDYHDNHLRLVDKQGRVILQVNRVDTGGNTCSLVVNNQVIAAEVTPAQARNLFWLRDFTVHTTFNGLYFKHAEYAGKEVPLADAQANVLAVDVLQFAYKNAQGGSTGIILADLTFIPQAA